jgi:O-antigen/teichoic acid export membrane protein
MSAATFPRQEYGKPETTLGSAAARDAAAYLPAQLIAPLFGFAALLLFTRMLGAERYGIYILGITSVNLCGDVCGEWVAQTALRFHAESEAAGRMRRYAATVGAVLGAACLSASLLALILLASIHSSTLAVAAIPLVCLTMAGKVGLAIVRARLQASRYTIVVVSGATVSFLASLILVWQFRTPVSLIAGQCAGAAVQLALLLPHLRLPFYSLPDPALARSMLAFGLPVAVTAIGSQALQYLDRFLLGAMRGPVELGLYAANYSLADRAIGLLFASLFLAAHPRMVQAWSEGRKGDVALLIDRIRRLTIIGGVPFVVLTAMAGSTLVGLLLTPEYASAVRAVPIVATGSLCWYLGILNHQPIELDKRTSLITAMVGLLAASNLILNLALIPRYGWLGASIATLAGYAGYFVLSRVGAARFTGSRWQFPWRTSITAIGSSALIFGVAMAIYNNLNAGRITLVFLLAIATLIYAATMWASGELKKAVSWC